MTDGFEPGRRIQHQSGFAAELARHLQRAVHMATRLGVKGDPGSAGGGEGADQVVDRLHHQMHVDGRGDAIVSERLAHHGSDGEVGHIVVVHHVEVNDIGAGGQHRVHLGAQAREIGGQDGRSDQVFGHVRVPVGKRRELCRERRVPAMRAWSEHRQGTASERGCARLDAAPDAHSSPCQSPNPSRSPPSITCATTCRRSPSIPAPTRTAARWRERRTICATTVSNPNPSHPTCVTAWAPWSPMATGSPPTTGCTRRRAARSLWCTATSITSGCTGT